MYEQYLDFWQDSSDKATKGLGLASFHVWWVNFGIRKSTTQSGKLLLSFQLTKLCQAIWMVPSKAYCLLQRQCPADFYFAG